MLSNLLRSMFGGSRLASPSSRQPMRQVISESKKLKYLSENGRGYFEFYPELMSKGYYKIHILRQPSYAGRDDNILKTHRYGNLPEIGGYRICVAENVESTIRTLTDIKKYAGMWAEATMNYIDHGTEF